MQAIVDKANADTAALRNEVIGTQSGDIRRDPARLPRVGDGQPGRRRDARASTRASRPRSPTPAACAQDILLARRRRRGEQPGEITWGEVFAVLPFGNRTVIETLTGAQLARGAAQRLQPGVQPAGRDRPLPAGLGPEDRVPLQRHDAGDRQASLERRGPGGPLTPIGPADTVRIVTNDFMFTGGDGYTAFARRHGRRCSRATLLLDVAIEYITAHSPVAPAVEGRITRG